MKITKLPFGAYTILAFIFDEMDRESNLGKKKLRKYVLSTKETYGK